MSNPDFNSEDIDVDPDDQDNNAGVFDEDKRRLDIGGDPRPVDEQIVVPGLDSEFVEEISEDDLGPDDVRRRQP
jgi:hypothetical protein